MVEVLLPAEFCIGSCFNLCIARCQKLWPIMMIDCKACIVCECRIGVGGKKFLERQQRRNPEKNNLERERYCKLRTMILLRNCREEAGKRERGNKLSCDYTCVCTPSGQHPFVPLFLPTINHNFFCSTCIQGMNNTVDSNLGVYLFIEIN